MKKKILCLFLIFAMLIPVCSAAYAEEEDPNGGAILCETGADEAEPSETGDEASDGEDSPTEEIPEDADEEDSVPAPGDTEEDRAEDETEQEDLLPPATDGSYQDEEKKIADRIITSGMSDLDKLITITKYAADNFSYSSRSSGDSAEGLLYYKSGNCYANAYFVIDLCRIVGIQAWLRPAGRDPSSSSTHVCAIAKIGTKYYTADAGYSGSAPRSFDVTERPYGLSVSDGVLYQYDGTGTAHLVIPSYSGDYYYKSKYNSKTYSGSTITQIGYSGQECFSYGGATGLKSITLPSTVKTVTATAFKGCKDLENIYVDAANPYFTSIDGVLYSKDLTRLVCVPAKKTSIVMPSTVTKQDSDAFYGGKIPVTISSGSTPFRDVTSQWFAESVRFVYDRSLFKGTSSTTFSPDASMTRGMFITVLGRFAGNGSWSALESWSGTLGVSTGSQLAVRDRTSTSGNVLARIGSAGEQVRVLSTVPIGADGATWFEVQYSGVTGYVRQTSTGSDGKTLMAAYTGSFADLPNGYYYTGYAQWANIFGIMNGVSSTAFRPNDNITRQDICVLLYRYLINYVGRPMAVGSGSFSDDAGISSYAKSAVYAMKEAGIISGYPDNTFRPQAYATRAEVAKIFQNLYNYLH